ncbi:MAG TPA: hypothetical protein VIV66_22095 [Pyrinomonadaceae bacterium]
MGSSIRITSILISLAIFARADLRLAPQLEHYELDGVKLEQLVFTDGQRRITYTPPRNWKYSNDGNRFLLHPASNLAAEAVISATKIPNAEVFDEATIKQLCDEVLASVPRGATNVAIVSQQLNPLVIERKETFLVVVNYDYCSYPYARSIMFLNRQNEQVRFQLTCYRNAFRDLQKAFQNSHYSWQNL